MNSIKNLSTFEVSITETLQLSVFVDAADADEAEDIVRDAYNRGEHVLGAEGFTGVDFRTNRTK
jgi:hypothetical protein